MSPQELTADGLIVVKSKAAFDAAIAENGNARLEIGGSLVLSTRLPGSAKPFIRLVASAGLKILAGSANVEAWGSAHVEARESAHVVARESSHVVARGSAHVVAWGDVFVRLFSAVEVKASANVTIMIHGPAPNVEGGRQMEASPEPTTGKEWCEYYGIKPDAPFKVDHLDARILSAIEADKLQLDMASWHGEDCNANNWCETTHCRAGAAICMAGVVGFELDRKYGAEMAGRMIYAVSRPDKELPDFHATNEDALADLRSGAAADPLPPKAA